MKRHQGCGPVCFLLLAAAAAAPCAESSVLDGNIAEGEYDHTLELAGGDYTLAWSISGDRITFGMSAKTGGWVAVGFDPVVVLDNADIVYGWVEDDTGEARVIDAHSLGAHGPTLPDTSRGGTDDIEDFAGTQREGVTTVEFTRLLDTGDPLDSALRPGDGNKLVWMYARTDDYRSRYTELGYAWLRAGGFAEDAPGGGGLTAAQILLAFGALVLLSWGLLSTGRLRRLGWWPAAYRVLGFAGALSGLASGGMTLYVNLMAPGEPLLFLHVLVAALTCGSLLAVAAVRLAVRPESTTRRGGGPEEDRTDAHRRVPRGRAGEVHRLALPSSLTFLLIHLFLRLVQGGLVG
jgi:hypothetical protein